jgi:protein O-GlcNAc transferase
MTVVTEKNEHYIAAVVHLEEGRLGEARAAFEQALAREPGRARIHANYAVCLAEQGAFDEADRVSRHAVELAPLDSYTVVLRARFLITRGKLDEARESIDAARDSGTSLADLSEGLIEIAWARIAAEDEAALGAALDAVAAAPEDAGAHAAHAVALALENRFGEARKAIERAVILDPDDKFLQTRRDLIQTGLDHLDESVEELEAPTKERPEDGHAWVVLGQLHLLRGKFDEAAACCERAIALDEKDAEAWQWKGIALQRAGRFPEDVEALQTAARLRGWR